MNADDVIYEMPDSEVLAEVLTILNAREHKDECPCIRDDHCCTCGRDALIFRVEQICDRLADSGTAGGSHG